MVYRDGRSGTVATMKSACVMLAHQFLLTSLLCAGQTAAAGESYPSALVVETLGNAGTSLNSDATSISLSVFTASGTYLRTLTSQFQNSTLLTDSGSASSNGYLNTYAGYMAVSGLNVAPGTEDAATLNEKATNIIDPLAQVVGRTVFPTGGATGDPRSPFSGGNFRSVIPTSANTFYATGTSNGSPSTGGVWHYDGADFVRVSSTQNNIRNVEIYGDQLYVTSGTSGFQGISTVGTGLPTTAGATTSLAIATGTGSSPYGFVIFDTNKDGTMDLAFVADDRPSVGGGIQRWDLNSSNVWTNTYSLLFNTGSERLTTSTGAGIVGIRGLTGVWEEETGTAALFATTTETSRNYLVTLYDEGTTPTSFRRLARAGENSVFRGLDFAPVPEPSTYVLAAIATGVLAWFGRKQRKSC
jgi:hypothetical protein